MHWSSVIWMIKFVNSSLNKIIIDKIINIKCTNESFQTTMKTISKKKL